MSAKMAAISHDTLVQEGNYLSHPRHIWQGDTPKIPAHMIKTSMSAEWAIYRQAPGEIPHLTSGVPRHLSKDL